MDSVGVSTEILELHTDEIALDGSNGRAGYLAVVGPCWELDARGDGDGGIDRLEGELTDGPTVLLVDVLRDIILFTTTCVELVKELVWVEVRVAIFSGCTEIPV
jgi:hypothetical protein